MRYMRNHDKDHVCVACGEAYDGYNHHCSQGFENGRKSAESKAFNELLRLSGKDKPMSLNQRLSIGFQMLSDE